MRHRMVILSLAVLLILLLWPRSSWLRMACPCGGRSTAATGAVRAATMRSAASRRGVPLVHSLFADYPARSVTGQDK